jgi:soluble lytic murein transglycosylase
VHGRARPAALAFDSMLALFPRSSEHTAARYWAGRAWKATGDGTRAATDWQAVVAEQPSSYYGLASARRLNRPLWAPAPATGKLPILRSVDSALARVALLEQLGMDAEARFELESLDEHAKSRDTTLALATALHDHGEESRAIRLTIRLIDQGDRDIRTYRLAFPLVDREELEAQSATFGLDPALVAGLIKQESSFDPRAVSVANARGLMQLLPSVGAEIAKALHYPVWSQVLLNDPDVNLQLGAAHVAAAIKQYADVTRALAAYNAGSSRVDRWSAKASVDDPELFAEQIPFVETRDYVRIVQRNAQIYRVLYEMK